MGNITSIFWNNVCKVGSEKKYELKTVGMTREPAITPHHDEEYFGCQPVQQQQKKKISTHTGIKQL